MNKGKPKRLAGGREAALPRGAEVRNLGERSNGSGQRDTEKFPCLHQTPGAQQSLFHKTRVSLASSTEPVIFLGPMGAKDQQQEGKGH